MKNKKNLFGQEGNLALNVNNQELISADIKVYEKPKIKKLILVSSKKKSNRIFMGCYQYNYQVNDGDGC